MNSIVSKVFLWISAVFGVAVFYLLHSYLPSLTGNTASFFISIAGGFIVFGFTNGFVLNRATPKNTPVLKIDEDEISVSYPDMKVEKIRIDEVSKIEIYTSNDGPFAEDFWWLFHGENRAEPLSVPQGALGNKGNLTILAMLESRFDNVDKAEMKKAIGSTNHARFLVWSVSKEVVP